MRGGRETYHDGVRKDAGGIVSANKINPRRCCSYSLNELPVRVSRCQALGSRGRTVSPRPPSRAGRSRRGDAHSASPWSRQRLMPGGLTER